MSKIEIDIENIKESLQNIGYIINSCTEKENNGTNWQLKFDNSGAIATIYDTNRKKNTVVNGKLESDEKDELKTIIDGIKCKEITIDPLNKKIVDLINLRKEDFYYDYKQCFNGEKESLLHDIICLSNNTENRESYLIFGVTDDCKVVGLDEVIRSEYVFDFLKSISFAGDHIPEVELKSLYYKCKKIAVIVCKSSKHVPFYLSRRYKGIGSGQIYTRVGDTNTPKDEHANYCDIEKLWRIHFEREKE